MTGIHRSFRISAALVLIAIVGSILTASQPQSIPKPQPMANHPRTPWGEPDFQGLWSTNAAFGIPFERPDGVTVAELTKEEAAARHAKRDQARAAGVAEIGEVPKNNVGTYDRAFRDIDLDLTSKFEPSRQVAMVIDPPNGKIPPLIDAARKRIATNVAARGGVSAGDLPRGGWANDLAAWTRCITRGLPEMILPVGYNNGIQIVQSPGYVAITYEMVHETRVIPTTPRPPLDKRLVQWLGDSRGRWEGNALVVDVSNFNGKVDFYGSTDSLHLVERFTRVSQGEITYDVTIVDPNTWSRPWTLTFPIRRDDTLYELVEYACHEANYGLASILSAGRVAEKTAHREKR